MSEDNRPSQNVAAPVSETGWRRIVPPVAAVLAIALFVRLGVWQLDRAAEKEALQDSFTSAEVFREPQGGELSGDSLPVAFDRLTTEGRLQTDRQILIDNIVKNGRLGYYVVTPLEITRNGPLLLVNRGWIERSPAAAGVDGLATDLAVGDEREPIRGRAGNLPRVGVRGGPGFADAGDEWPRIGVYPTADEVADELDRDVLPWTLLLEPDDERGFLRDWQPNVSGPSTHYGYAFQWFAMAAAVLALAIWNYRSVFRSARTRDQELSNE